MIPAPPRFVSPLHVLAFHPQITWQIAIALAIALIALGATNAGAGYFAILLFMLAGFVLLVVAMRIHLLLTYDLALLRRGIVVNARVEGPAVAGGRRPLYQVNYPAPGDPSETPRMLPGFFLARNGYVPAPGDSVLLLVDPEDTEKTVEVTGLYDTLLQPASSASR